MNKPAFSQWASQNQQTPSMESFGDLLNKLKIHGVCFLKRILDLAYGLEKLITLSIK